MPDEEYDLKLTGDGVTVERKVPAAVAQRIMVLVMGGGGLEALPPPNTGANAAAGDGAGSGLRPQESIGEFLSRSGATEFRQKIVVLGRYLELTGADSFTAQDLQQAFQAAREPLPTNLRRDVRAAIQERWIAEKLGQKGAYHVTRTGVEAIDRSFAKEPRKPVASRKRAAKKAVAAE
jgi:hypothetical protein